MNRQILTVNFCVVATFAVGCQPEARPPALEKRGAASNRLNAASEELEEAVRDPHVYGDVEQSAWARTLEDPMIAIDRDLGHLSAILKYTKADAPVEANSRLKAVRHQAALLRKQLEHAKAASALAWHCLKAGWRVCLRIPGATAPNGMASSRTCAAAAYPNSVAMGVPIMATANGRARYPGGMVHQVIRLILREVRDGLKQSRQWVKNMIAL